MGVWIETGSLNSGSNEYPEFELGWIDFQSLRSSRQNDLTYFDLFIVSTTTKVDGQHFISDRLYKITYMAHIPYGNMGLPVRPNPILPYR